MGRVSLRVVTLVAATVVAAGLSLGLWSVWFPEREPLRFSGGTEGGTYAAFAEAFHEALEKNSTVELTVLASAGANANAERLARGEVDAALIQSDTAVGPGTQIVARAFPEAFHLVVRVDFGHHLGQRSQRPPRGADAGRFGLQRPLPAPA